MRSKPTSQRKRPVVFPVLVFAVLAAAQCAMSQRLAGAPPGVEGLQEPVPVLPRSG